MVVNILQQLFPINKIAEQIDVLQLLLHTLTYKGVERKGTGDKKNTIIHVFVYLHNSLWCAFLTLLDTCMLFNGWT